MKRLSTKGFDLVNGARRLLFPSACLFCQQPLNEGGMLSHVCCHACFEKTAIWPRSVCSRCGSALPEAMAPGPCGHCLTRPPAQAATMSLYAYKGPVRDAILNWKLQGQDAGVRWLLDAAMPRIKELINADDLLLPVPMPLSRMRKSGVHHSADLCRWLSAGVGCGWDWQLLRRVGEQPRQSALSGVARRKNLRRAFALAADFRASLADASTIWIVDDILTTGSTLNFAARAAKPLKRDVKVLSLARTLNRG
ncbi:ComF family protein [Mariprofundus sp. KV]|uniref:ComF family protein n=1 Tax=Mariprofundus sp. KV TaxID=2608715 RepID=UPI001F50CA9B|nr:ComF family protein [Mariprofundus sp. KV]